MWRNVLILILSLSSHLALAVGEGGVKGQVHMSVACSKKAMVWLSLDEEDFKKRLLLMHTLVPAGGKFEFYLRPGKYQLRASDENGCDYLKRIVVGPSVQSVNVKLGKK